MNIQKHFCSAVIVAAGSSSRMGFDKIFADIHGIPVIAVTLSAFNSCNLISEIIIVTRESSLKKMACICQQFHLSKVKKIIIGANTRAGSSLYGVMETNSKADFICIHDGARPYVSDELIQTTFQAAFQHHAAAPGLVPKDTIKVVGHDGLITSTLNREELRQIQTPQAFDAAIIKAALSKAVSEQAAITDDCSAVERIGMKPFIVSGDERNIKLTTPEDIKIAEMISAEWRLKVNI